MFDYIKSNPLIFIIIFLLIVSPQFVFGALGVVAYIIMGIIILLFVLGLIFRFRIQRLQNQMRDEMNRGAGNPNGGFTYTRSWSSRGSSAGGANQSSNSSSDGVKVVVEQKGKDEKKFSKNVGEYVDFEEMDE